MKGRPDLTWIETKCKVQQDSKFTDDESIKYQKATMSDWA